MSLIIANCDDNQSPAHYTVYFQNEIEVPKNAEIAFTNIQLSRAPKFTVYEDVNDTVAVVYYYHYNDKEVGDAAHDLMVTDNPITMLPAKVKIPSGTYDKFQLRDELYYAITWADKSALNAWKVEITSSTTSAEFT